MKEVPFKANDIRGAYPKEVNADLFYSIGKSISKIIHVKEIAVGRDIRLSSDSLFKALVKGLNESGISVLDLGLCDTPHTYFISGQYGLPACMITASHNPKQFNGLKIINPHCIPLSESQVAMLIDTLHKENYSHSEKQGKVEKFNKMKEYSDFLLKQVDKKDLSPLKIVIDCSNGMAATIVPDVFSKLPAKITYINKKPDGKFPGHTPNSAIDENLKQLQSAVIKNKADLGIIYDGDCDRVSFVDDKGGIISSSTVAGIIAHDLLLKHPGSNIIHTVNMSINLVDSIKLYSGNPILAEIGHRFMKTSMKENKAIFGAEYSGHYYFKEYWNADSGILASLVFYSILSKLKTPVSLISKNFTKYFSTGEINYKVKNRDIAFNNVKRYINALNPKKVIVIDGYAALLENGYVTLRKSNTEAVIRITIESKDKAFLESVKRDIDRII